MDTFRAVADPVRRRLVEHLARQGATSAGELAAITREGFGISQPATSKHLRALLDAGVVTRTVAAQRRVYRLEPAALDELAAWATRQTRFWATRLDALEDHLQGDRPTQPDRPGQWAADPSAGPDQETAP